MTGPASAGALPRPIGRAAFLALAAVVALAVLGAGVATGRPVIAAGAAGCVGMSAAVLAGVVGWRFPLYGLLLYLPVSGIPILATYPHTGPAVLLKDVLFVVPSYLGFAACLLTRRIRLAPAPLPVVLVTMLAILVVLQALNPALPNRLVGAIGIKVWLFYIPLAFLGYHLVRDRRDVTRLLALMSLSALLPAVIGIAEGVLYRAGQAAFVYRFYGGAAGAATALFTELHLPSGGVLHRVPSTFSSWTQYYAFVLSMVPITYAWWRGTSARGSIGRAVVWLVLVVAAFTSGARVAFVAVPVVLALTLLFEYVGVRQGAARLGLARVAVPVGALAAAALLLAVTAGGLVSDVAWKAKHEFTGTFLGRFHQAVEITWLGLGSGIDTIASRYAAPPEVLFASFGGIWYEGWFSKVALELGVPGVALVVAIFCVLLARGLHRHLAVRDPGLKTVSAALLAFLVVNVLFAVSKPYLDADPINVYFWLFAGLLARVATLDAAPGDARED